MQGKDLEGVIPAIVTPFTENGELDREGLKRLTRFLLDNGVHGIMTTGGNGEFPHLLREEKRRRLIGKGNIEAQTEQCIKNVEAALKKLGGSLDDVVAVTVFVKDMSGLKTIHDVRLRYFREPYPTSTLVEVKGFINPDALIEINALAAV
jgi:Putative translation initiation inhibitor, yjgF family